MPQLSSGLAHEETWPGSFRVSGDRVSSKAPLRILCRVLSLLSPGGIKALETGEIAFWAVPDYSAWYLGYPGRYCYRSLEIGQQEIKNIKHLKKIVRISSLQTSSSGSLFLNNYILSDTHTFKIENVKNKCYNPKTIKALINFKKRGKIGEVGTHSKQSQAENLGRRTAGPRELFSKRSGMWRTLISTCLGRGWEGKPFNFTHHRGFPVRKCIETDLVRSLDEQSLPFAAKACAGSALCHLCR